MKLKGGKKVKKVFAFSLAVLMIVSGYGSIAMANGNNTDKRENTVYDMNAKAAENLNREENSAAGTENRTDNHNKEDIVGIDETDNDVWNHGGTEYENSAESAGETEGSGSDESEAEGSGAGESETVGSGSDESKTQESSADESGTEGSGAGESEAEGSGTDESETEESGSDESETQESSADESGTEGSSADESETPESNVNDNETDESADEAEIIEITEWRWEDSENNIVWSEENARWELPMPGAAEANPVSHEDILGQLPRTVSISGEDIKEEEKETAVELAWDLSAVPETVYEGEYTLTASIADNYRLSEAAGKLEITAIFGDAETEKISDEILDKNRVEGISPNGTTINMFDYWLQERTSPDNNSRSKLIRDKINIDRSSGKERNLLFLDDVKNVPLRNRWTGGAAPRQGLVENVLSGGYPKTKDEFQESLAYLFDGTNFDGKQAFMEVGGLLRVDTEGYYYYDCFENYAYLNEKTNTVELYNQPAKIEGGNKGQFFPFTDPSLVFSEGADGTLTTDEKFKQQETRHEDLNHYFGMTMATRFIQQDGGRTDKGNAVTYEFRGDDDVWVFIDDVLVADLGGIHAATSVKIDFTDGRIVINAGTKYEINSTLKQQFEAAGKSDSVKWRDNTFDDGTYHTLKFFYLERGNDESNMHLKFNLVTVPESDIIKIDQVGNPIAGAEFTLYESNEDYTEIGEVIASGVTDSDGTFVLTDAEGYIVSINDLEKRGYKYFILKETKIPDGYRMLGDAKLYVSEGAAEPTILSYDYWNTGTYAMSKVTVTAPTNVSDINGKVYTEEDIKNGEMFAVVLKYTGPLDGNGKADVSDLNNDKNWKAVSGDAMNGWYVHEKEGIDGVIEAVKENSYTFHLDSSGAYKTEIENIPGDITTYYYMLTDENKGSTKYTVAYYFTTGSGVQDATVKNTVRLKSDDDGDYKGFAREFSVSLYVPNIKNQFLVQKVDEEGTAVNGAEFALYKKEDIKVNPDGTWEVSDDKTPYDTVTTREMSQENGDMLNLKGAAMFPSDGKVLPIGEYYLVETKAPEGYKINTKPVPVVAETLKVYADAGEAGDGIVVNRGVGYLVKSMEQFAADDDIDATLHDIKAFLEVSDEFLPEEEWDIAAADTDDGATHLSYSVNSAELQYGPIDGYPKFLSTDTGWSRLKIQQCPEHEKEDLPKQDLGDMSLGNLFSGTLIVQVTNQKAGNLKIRKKVESVSNPNPEQEFNFSLTLTDKNNEPLKDTYTAVRYDKDGQPVQPELIVEQGQLDFSLKDGEYIDIKDIPAGTKFTAEEKNIPDGFRVSVSVDGQEAREDTKAEGSIEQSTAQKQENEVLFTNTYTTDAVLTGKSAVKVKKTLLGRNISASDSFEFWLIPGDEATKQAAEAGEIIFGSESGSAQEAAEGLTGAISGDGTANTGAVSLGDITFKQEGTYQFKISELLPDGVTAENPESGGIIYDTHIAAVTVTVSKKENSEVLEASVRYDNSAALTEADKSEKAIAAFTNKLSGDFSFTKQNKEGQPLPGVGFGLYREICTDTGHNHEDELIEIDADGNPTGESAGCWELVKTAVSGDDGKVSFTGLAVCDDSNSFAEYRLAEIQTPDGYLKVSGQWKIRYEDGKFIVPEGSAVGNPTAIAPDGNDGYILVNYKPGELPVSGGRGTAAFLAAGAGLMSVAAFGTLLYLKGRRRKQRTA